MGLLLPAEVEDPGNVVSALDWDAVGVEVGRVEDSSEEVELPPDGCGASELLDAPVSEEVVVVVLPDCAAVDDDVVSGADAVVGAVDASLLAVGAEEE